MKDYTRLDQYLNELEKDIYPQPVDAGHTAWAKAALDYFATVATVKDLNSVLDIGCGEGFSAYIFNRHHGIVQWQGVTKGEDVKKVKELGLPVTEDDMSFLSFEDNSFDMIFARHVLEHSPFPLLTLMEWHRVSKDVLFLVAPAPEYWGWGGQNHYSIMQFPKLNWLLRRAGWIVIGESGFKENHPMFKEHNPKHEIDNPHHPKLVEYWLVCRKAEPIEK